jgi:hypothetical protein
VNKPSKAAPGTGIPVTQLSGVIVTIQTPSTLRPALSPAWASAFPCENAHTMTIAMTLVRNFVFISVVRWFTGLS